MEESKSNNNDNTWYNNNDEIVKQFEDEDKLLWKPTLTTKPDMNSNNKFILELGSEDDDKAPTFKAVVMKGTKANKVETIEIVCDGKEDEGNENNNNNCKHKKTTSILKTKIIHDGKEHEGNRNRNTKRKVKWAKPKLNRQEYKGNEFNDKENIITKVKTMVHKSKKRIQIYD